MSTVSHLTTALSGVSLSRRSTAFTLVSSDGQRFDVDSAVLAFHSKVFADMFETVGESDEADRACDSAEDGATVKAFLEALMEGEGPGSERVWVGVWRMMDKYECKALRAPLLVVGWSQLDGPRPKPTWAYAAGCLLRHVDLAWAALLRCDPLGTSTASVAEAQAFRALSPELQALYSAYRRDMAEQVQPTFAEVSFERACYCSKDKSVKHCDKGIWEDAVDTVVWDFKTSDGNLVELLRNEMWERVGDWGDCSSCGKKLKRQVDEVEFEWKHFMGRLDAKYRQKLVALLSD